MKNISLSDNVDIGFRGVQMIREMHFDLTLKRLDLEDGVRRRSSFDGSECFLDPEGRLPERSYGYYDVPPPPPRPFDISYTSFVG